MSEEYLSRTLRAYSKDPQKYEAATASMTPKKELEYFISLLPKTDLPVLDAGCAFGRDTAFFAKKGLDVIGIDLTDAFIKRAKQIYPEIVFHKMDVRSLHFADESFAGISSHATLLHLKDEDVLKALREFWRVLVPGGAIVVSFKEGTGDEEIVEKFSSNSARYYNYQNKESAERLVKASGLTIVKIHSINEREQFGPAMRDLNWVWCFAKK